jgi:hypothetical protein
MSGAGDFEGGRTMEQGETIIKQARSVIDRLDGGDQYAIAYWNGYLQGAMAQAGEDNETIGALAKILLKMKEGMVNGEPDDRES